MSFLVRPLQRASVDTGGIFLDNIVPVFDYDDRRVGFADIAEEELGISNKIGGATSPGRSPQHLCYDPENGETLHRQH